MKYFIISLLTLCIACNNSTGEIIEEDDSTMYFPENDGNTWSTKSIRELNWNSNVLEPLKDYLTVNNSKSFMILVNGKIVVEEYFNNHNINTTWEWNSAGKTLVTATTGILQQNGLLDINNKVSAYNRNWVD